MNALELRLLNDFQRDFPLCAQPYAALAAQLGSDEPTILDTLQRLHHDGCLSRIGAVFAPRRVGASTLAALAVPPEQLENIADRVSAYPEVNHNYEREHRFNLWFVVTASDAQQLERVLRDIKTGTGCQLIVLPLLEEFHIDLGFDLQGGGRTQGRSRRIDPADMYHPTDLERVLMAALQAGLELVPRPFDRLAQQTGLGEDEILAMIESWLADGRIKRFGVVVRHHELGYNANAMTMWDVPDGRVGELGALLAQEPAVTLCYRRERHLPAWSYNLYCMIHGRERAQVVAQIKAMRYRLGLVEFPHAVLFSRQRFKQQGARYFQCGDATNG
jgi:DNA-binding Lrp family transcriptional regulator